MGRNLVGGDDFGESVDLNLKALASSNIVEIVVTEEELKLDYLKVKRVRR
jgi:hypothetical protein